MKKICFIFLLLPIVKLSFACQGKLSYNYSRDSASFYLFVDDLDYTYKSPTNCYSEEKDKIFALEAVKAIMKNQGCTHSETLSLRKNNVECHRFNKVASNALVCSISTYFGFFYFTRDGMDGAYVIFNRWD